MVLKEFEVVRKFCYFEEIFESGTLEGIQVLFKIEGLGICGLELVGQGSD